MFVNATQYVPGSVVKVWSARYLCFHFGVVDSPEPFTGAVRVIHSAKGSFVRTTSLVEFAEGRQVEVIWVPRDYSQQFAVLQRMHSLDGKPYDLFVANCEHVVNWALTGKSYSPQLAIVLVVCLVGAAAAVVSAGRA